MDHLQKELAELVDRHTGKEGPQATAIPSLSFSRYSSSHPSKEAGLPYKINKPSIYMVVQGIKAVVFGEDRFRYGPPNYRWHPWICR